MKVLVIASWYPSQENPVFGSFIDEQVKVLIDSGLDVTVLYPHMLGTFMGSLFRKDYTKLYIGSYGQSVVEVGVKPVIPLYRRHSFGRLFNLADSALSYYNIKYDIIHSHSTFMAGYIAYRLNKQKGKRYIHTEHTSNMALNSAIYSEYEKSLVRNVFGSAKRTVFVSSFSKERTLSNFEISMGLNHVVFPNVIDDRFFHNHNMLSSEAGLKYIAIGNLVKVKRFDMLLEAWNLYKKDHKKCTLTIAGSGIEREFLDSKISRMSLDQSVTLVPRLSRDEVVDAIISNHVLVSSSKLETFGLTVAEALSCGCPVVVTDSGGVRDFVDSTNGIITEHNVISLSNGLSEMHMNYAKYNKAAIAERMRARFHPTEFYKGMVELYMDAIE